MSYVQKLSRIQSYLKSLFSECSIHIEPEFEQSTFCFRVDDPDGRVKHLLAVSEEFLSELETWNVKRVMGEAGRMKILVSTSGLKMAEQD